MDATVIHLALRIKAVLNDCLSLDLKTKGIEEDAKVKVRYSTHIMHL